MAGKKRQRNAARAAQYAKRSAGTITDKHKARKQKNHATAVEKQAVKTTKTTEIFEKVCSKYELNSKGKYALKRLIGTLNAHRLNAVLEGTVKEQSWYPGRFNNLRPVDQTKSIGDDIVRKETNASQLIRSTKLSVFL